MYDFLNAYNETSVLKLVVAKEVTYAPREGLFISSPWDERLTATLTWIQKFQDPERPIPSHERVGAE